MTAKPTPQSKSAPETSREAIAALGDYQPPTNALETVLVKHWQASIGYDRIGIDDNFFVLGGTSLQAAELFGKLSQEQGIKLPLATLYDSPTVRLLATYINNKSTGEDISSGGASDHLARIVPISSEGNDAPIFIVPGVGGDVIGLGYLAQALGNTQPIYGLRSRGLDGSETPHTSVQEIANEFKEEIMRTGSEPCRLLGICWGGTVALEIARQLKAAGRDVSQLVLFDPPSVRQATTGPGPVESMAIPRFIARRLALYWQDLRQLSGAERWQYIRQRISMIKDIVIKRDVFRGDTDEFNRMKVRDANIAALQNYTPKAFDGPTRLLLTTGREDSRSRRGRETWIAALGPACQVTHVPGTDTGEAISPGFADKLAAILQESSQTDT